MIFCLVGKVTRVDTTTLFIEEIPSSEVFKMTWTGREDISNAQGETGIFYGEYSNQEFLVKRVDIRKLLTPLWENDIVDNAITAIIGLEKDPFEGLFKQYFKDE